MQRAYAQVRDAILTGEMKPGSWVPQVQLAARLQVSRTPLREALRRLQTEGLVQQDFNGRLRVAPLSVPDLESLYALRIVCEPLAVKLSVPQLENADVAELSQALTSMNLAADRGDQATVLEQHRRFHFGLFSYADDRMRDQVENMWEHAVRYVRIYNPEPDYRFSIIAMGRTDHDRIYAAVAAGQEAEAARLVAQHLARTALTVIATVAGGHDPRVVREALNFVLCAAPAANGKP
jgi:DNA-binding GntR family transcriptional regulator